MQGNKSTTKHCTTPEEFFEYLLSGKFHVSAWDFFSDEVAQVTFRREDGFIEPNPQVNVVLAA